MRNRELKPTAGKVQSRVGKLQKILGDYPEISPDWLLFGQGNMLREEYIQESLVPIFQQSSHNIDKLLERIESQSEEIGRLKEENRNLKEKMYLA